ncbi:Na/Pi symporter [Caballeronia calidae]|uniref:Na/Pi symporter n=1 Tax=Caballeronia calidae TaxID=1777139 RepID=UPI0007874BB7|nr:Na/Pi symporter [Caballeronia calidae]
MPHAGFVARDKQWLALAAAPWAGVLAGLVFTALVQSSSVTTGVAILLVQQGVLPPEAAIPIVIGSNVGSTSTALIAGLGMKPVARATAIANFLFNAAGMIVYYPFLRPFSRVAVELAANPGMAVARAHLIFNLTVDLQPHGRFAFPCCTAVDRATASQLAARRRPALASRLGDVTFPTETALPSRQRSAA